MKNKTLRAIVFVCIVGVGLLVFLGLDFHPYSGSAAADLKEQLAEVYGAPYTDRMIEEKETAEGTVQRYESLELSVVCADRVTWNWNLNRFFKRATEYHCQVRITQETLVKGEMTETTARTVTYEGYDDNVLNSPARASIDWNSKKETRQ